MVNSMVTMDELFQMDGINAVGQIDDLGRIVDWKAKGIVDHETKEATSKFSEAITSLIDQEARIVEEQVRQANWRPRRGWIYSGGDMTVIAAGNYFLVVDNDKVNLDKLFGIFGLFGRGKK